ncbi:ABC transporter ATP-binding protein [Tianweitania sediminis]|uniref:ABC transporter ATP-binding protein n=1 Tax=Tianweitania sediminis TaxID=1502156 RepID=A0A8J7RAI9_9HYPH|nr:ABC transporter ATP-binding protein [Tianweitania sediminis]MBP0441432.1 ABC transporter ATP-binding protein [Tianweitania sediminis]
MNMPSEEMLRVNDITLSYRVGDIDMPVLNGVSFTVEPGELFTLLGPSGCGKTSTLRSVAGLETPTSGEITIGGETVYSSSRKVQLAPNRRRLAMVFQSYAIWPHMTVAENVAFPLRRMRVDPPDRRRRVDEALGMVGLAGEGQRSATLLSGGQQQRVALARALVSNPRMILLDEPLSNLDAKLREQMRGEIRDLQRRSGTTAVFVTHDQAEALAMSDRIAVMDKGNIVEMGNPETLYLRPRKKFTAQFLGQALILPIDGLEQGSGTLQLRTRIGVVEALADTRVKNVAWMAARPEHLTVAVPGAQIPGGIPARVVRAQFTGSTIDLELDAGGVLFAAVARNDRKFAPGDEVTVSFDPSNIILLES